MEEVSVRVSYSLVLTLVLVLRDLPNLQYIPYNLQLLNRD